MKFDIFDDPMSGAARGQQIIAFLFQLGFG
jgi:hypothetical protein